MTARDIDAWLADLGLGHYAGAFAENDVDLRALPHLDQDDLKELGVSLGHRKIILAAIAEGAAGVGPAAMPAVPSTGERMQPAERRQVTVLFADLSGFTTLTSELDVEETHSLLNGFFATVDNIVRAYGGHVDKHIGDAVMAVFGAPVAHTDDPERALRAALDIHPAVAALEPPLRVHIGVASGEVMASATGSTEHSEYTVTGDSVNLASRLTDLAATGETLTSGAVQRALGDRFLGEDLGQQAIEGLATPIAVWRLAGLSADAEDAQIFVGRTRELRQFAAALDNCLESGRGEALVLRGEGGIGKTRLLREFAARAAARGVAVHTALVLDFGTGKDQDPVYALVRDLLGIEPGSSENEQAARAEAAFAKGWLDERRRAHINNLLDMEQPPELGEMYEAMDNEARNRGRREAVGELVVAVSGEQPLLLRIEDVHWASPRVLAYLAHLASAIEDAPCLLVMTTRVAGDPIDAEWRGQVAQTPIATIDLGPLRAEEARGLAKEFAAAADLVDTCIARSGGNPLFLEQLLRNADELDADNIPGTIQGIVQARLDVLAPEDRNAIQAAAVLGQRIPPDALSYLLDVDSYDPANLVRLALVRPSGQDYHFAHALIRDGAYGSMLNAQKLDLHRRAAAWFEERDLTLHAEHLALANDPGAAIAYLAAGRHAAALFRQAQGLALIERGLTLDSDAETRFALLCTRGDLLSATGRPGEAFEAFQAAESLAQGDNDAYRASMGMAQTARVSSRYNDALESLATAERLAEIAGDSTDIAAVHYLRGNVYFPLGRIDDCLASSEQALRFAKEAGSTRLEVGALSNFGDAHYLRGTMLTATDYYTQAIDLARAHDLIRDLAANLHNRAITSIFGGDIERGSNDARESVRLGQQLDIPLIECVALVSLSWSAVWRGRLSGAKAKAERSLNIAREIGAKRFEAQGYANLAMVLHGLGERAAAETFARESVTLSTEYALNFCAPRCYSMLASVVEDADEQQRLLDEGECILAEGCVSHNHFFFYPDAMGIMLSHGRWDAAERYAAALEAFTAGEPLPYCDFMIRHGRALARLGREGGTPEAVEAVDACIQQARVLDLNPKAEEAEAMLRRLLE